jgi:hypothetical protein
MPSIPSDLINELKTSPRKPKVIVVFSDIGGIPRLAFGETRGQIFKDNNTESEWINSHQNEYPNEVGNPEGNEPSGSTLPEPLKLYPFLKSVGKIKHKVDIKNKKIVIPNVSIKMFNLGIDRKIFHSTMWAEGQFTYSLQDEFLTDMLANPYWKRGLGVLGTTDNVDVPLVSGDNDIFSQFEDGWGNASIWGNQILYNMIGMTVNIYYSGESSINQKTKTISLERCANMQDTTVKSYKQDTKYATLQCESFFSEIAQKDITLDTFDTDFESSNGKYKPLVFGDERYHTLYPEISIDDESERGIKFNYLDNNFSIPFPSSLNNLILLEGDNEYTVPTNTRFKSLVFGEKETHLEGLDGEFKHRIRSYDGIYNQWTEADDGHRIYFKFRDDCCSQLTSYSEENLIYVSHKEIPRIQPAVGETFAEGLLTDPYALQVFPMRSLAHQDRTQLGTFGVLSEMATIVKIDGGFAVEGGQTLLQLSDAYVLGVNSGEAGDGSVHCPNAKGAILSVKILTGDHSSYENSLVDTHVDMESHLEWFPFTFPSGTMPEQNYMNRLSSYLLSITTANPRCEEVLQTVFDVSLIWTESQFLEGMPVDSNGFPSLLDDDIISAITHKFWFDLVYTSQLTGGDIQTNENGMSKKVMLREWTDDDDWLTQEPAEEGFPIYDRWDINDFMQYDNEYYANDIYQQLNSGEEIFNSHLNLRIVPNSGYGVSNEELPHNQWSSYNSTENLPLNENNQDVYAVANVELFLEKLALTHHFLKPDLLDSVDRMYVKGDGFSMLEEADYLPTIVDYRNMPMMQVAYLWRKTLGMQFMGVGTSDYKYQIIYQALNQDGTINQLYPSTSNYTISEPETLLSATENILKHTNSFPFLMTTGSKEKLASFLIKDTYIGNETMYDFRLIDMDYLKIKVETTKIKDICTGAEVIYGGDKYELGLDKILKTDTATAQDYYPDYDYDFYNTTQGAGHQVLECPNINSLEEANRYRDFYIKNNCNQKIKIKMTLPLKYIDLHIGSIIRFDYLPEDMRVLGKDYTTSWYSQMINPNIYFDEDEMDFSEIPEEGSFFQYDEPFKQSEIKINGQYFLPFFVVNKCDYSIDSVEIEVLQLMHLKDYLGAPPQPCDDGVCYNPDEVFFPVEGCTIPYATNYSFTANQPTNSICEFTSSTEQVPPAYLDDNNVMRAGWVDIKLKHGQLVIPYEDNTETYYTNPILAGYENPEHPQATRRMTTLDTIPNQKQCSTDSHLIKCINAGGVVGDHETNDPINDKSHYWTYPYIYANVLRASQYDTTEYAHFYSLNHGIDNSGAWSLVKFSDLINNSQPNYIVNISKYQSSNIWVGFTVLDGFYNDFEKYYISLLLWYRYYVTQDYFAIPNIGYVPDGSDVTIGDYINSWGIVKDGDFYVYEDGGGNATVGANSLIDAYETYIAPILNALGGGVEHINELFTTPNHTLKDKGEHIMKAIAEDILDNLPTDDYSFGVSTESPVTAGGEPAKMLWQFNYSQRVGVYTDYDELPNGNDSEEVRVALDGQQYENAWGVPMGRLGIEGATTDTKYVNNSSQDYNWVSYRKMHGENPDNSDADFDTDTKLRIGNPLGTLYENAQGHADGLPQSDAGLPVCAVQYRSHKNPYQNQTDLYDFVALATENFGFCSHPYQKFQVLRTAGGTEGYLPAGLLNIKNNNAHSAFEYIRIWNYSTSPIDIPFNNTCYERAWDSNTDPALYGDFVYEAGDINLDGFVNVLDVVQIATYVINPANFPLTDEQFAVADGFTNDGIINILDIVSVVQSILNIG